MAAFVLLGSITPSLGAKDDGIRDIPRPVPTPTAVPGTPEVFQEVSVDSTGVIRLAVSDRQLRHFDAWGDLNDRISFWEGESAWGSQDGELVLLNQGPGGLDGLRVKDYRGGPDPFIETRGGGVLPDSPDYFHIVGNFDTEDGQVWKGAVFYERDGQEKSRMPGSYAAVAASPSGRLLLVQDMASGLHELLAARGRKLWSLALPVGAGFWHRQSSAGAALRDDGTLVVASSSGGQGRALVVDGGGRIVLDARLDVPFSALSESGRYVAAIRERIFVEVFDLIAGGGRLRYEYRVNPINPHLEIHQVEVSEDGYLAVVTSEGRLLLYDDGGDSIREPDLAFPPGRITSIWSGRFLEALGAHGLASVEWRSGRVVDVKGAESF